MTIILNGLIVLILIAGMMMLYHLYKYYRTSSDMSVRGYDVEKHNSMATSRAVILATLITVYVVLLALIKK